MFDLQMYGEIGSDETARYTVILEKEYTVRTFIETVLKERANEWGIIKILGKTSFEYRKGKLFSSINEDILDKAIVDVKASGGWTRMDYLIKI